MKHPLQFIKIKSTILLLPALFLPTACFEKPSSGSTDPSEEIIVEVGNEKADPAPAPKKETPKPVKPAKPKKPAVDPLDKYVKEQYPDPKILPLDKITKSWSDVPARAYPKQIKAQIPIALDLVMNGKVVGETKINPGQPLKPLKLNGDSLTVSALTNEKLSTVIPVSQTDFKEQIQKRYDDFVAEANKRVKVQREKAKKMLAARQKEEKAAATSSAAITTFRTPSRGQSISENDPRLSPVKSSIRSGAVPAEISEVVSYSWNGSEKVGGQVSGTYDTVNVRFSSRTIFGQFNSEYKCLLNGSKVVAWIDPITQEKIVNR